MRSAVTPHQPHSTLLRRLTLFTPCGHSALRTLSCRGPGFLGKNQFELGSMQCL